MAKRKRRRTVLYLAEWNVAAVHEGIAAYALEAGWVLDNTMCYSGRIPRKVRPDGVIFRAGPGTATTKFTRSLGVPVVGFEDDRFPQVYYDHRAIGAMAARHLIGRGFKVLGFLHLHHTPSQMPRMDGFRHEVEAAGCRFLELCPPRKAPSWHPPPPGKAWAWLRKALDVLDGPVGVMVTNDLPARFAIDALVAMGYEVPARVAVVSAENDPLICEVGAVTISSVNTDTRGMGYEAARLLDRMMDGEPPPRKTRLVEPTHVEKRDSSDIRAVDNLHAARVLHYIWRHYREPMRVADAARAADVSRRRVQTLFREAIGRTPQEEIARIRTVRACHLLRTTSLRIHEIAPQCGFSSGLHLHRTFQAVLGMGPRAFRESGTTPDLGLAPATAFAPRDPQ